MVYHAIGLGDHVQLLAYLWISFLATCDWSNYFNEKLVCISEDTPEKEVLDKSSEMPLPLKDALGPMEATLDVSRISLFHL